MRLLVLSRAWYDEYHPTYLSGPDAVTESQFAALCESLMPQAAKLALADATMADRLIGYGEITDKLVTLLPPEFERLSTTEYTVCGEPIIVEPGRSDGPYRHIEGVGHLISEHNNKSFVLEDEQEEDEHE